MDLMSNPLFATIAFLTTIAVCITAIANSIVAILHARAALTKSTQPTAVPEQITTASHIKSRRWDLFFMICSLFASLFFMFMLVNWGLFAYERVFGEFANEPARIGDIYVATSGSALIILLGVQSIIGYRR